MVLYLRVYFSACPLFTKPPDNKPALYPADIHCLVQSYLPIGHSLFEGLLIYFVSDAKIALFICYLLGVLRFYFWDSCTPAS